MRGSKRRGPKRYGRVAGFAVLAGLMAAMAAGQVKKPAAKAAGSGRAVLYAAAGNELMQFDVDLGAGALVKRNSVMLPEGVQEAWPHPSGKFLYVTWSNGVLGLVPPGEKSPHGVTAFRIDPATGALTPHGDPISLRARAVFMTTDMDGTHIVVANNDPSGVTVHTIKPDGTLGSPVPPGGTLDVGVYAHNVRVDPSNQAVILVTRGNGPTATKKEDPGAIKIFNYKNGVLTNRKSVAPDGGFNFQVRHLDFHPSGKWDYVTLERQNKLFVFGRSPDGSLSDSPLFMKDTLPEPGRGQAPSTIHVHPNGRFVYLANRGSGKGGENSIAVFSINQETGEPTLIQRADTHGLSPRTFSLDPSAKLLVVANQSARVENGVTVVPACLSVYKVGDDGKLDFVRKYDVETSATKLLFWTGFVGLP
jgi:6-phosphogluconolactonase